LAFKKSKYVILQPRKESPNFLSFQKNIKKEILNYVQDDKKVGESSTLKWQRKNDIIQQPCKEFPFFFSNQKIKRGDPSDLRSSGLQKRYLQKFLQHSHPKYWTYPSNFHFLA
jgi:hypothetical protein